MGDRSDRCHHRILFFETCGDSNDFASPWSFRVGSSNTPYTESHPDSGFLLAFRYRPVRRLNLLRPKDLKFRQHGWLKENDIATLRRWGVTSD